MKLHILFGHRAERYAGEYAPEPLICWSEHEVDENPEGFAKDIESTTAARNHEFAVIRLVNVNVDGDRIMRLMHEPPTVEGTLDDE